MQNNGDDKNKSPKKSVWKRFWKAWRDWWRLTFESYIVEVQDRILMSWKRIIKFIGITIIPILYGVICSVAIWNPIEEIGRAQTIVMDNDYSMLLVSDVQNNSVVKNGVKSNNQKFIFGAVKGFNNGNDIKDYFSGTGLDVDKDVVLDPNSGAIGIKNSALKNEVERNKISAIIFNNAIKGDNGIKATFNLATYGNEDSDIIDNIDNTVTYNPQDADFSFSLATTWDIIRGALIPKDDKDANVADKDYKFKSPVIVKQENVALKNIKYSSDVDWNNDHWTKNAGYMQVKIPTWYTANLINYGSLFFKAQSLDSDSKIDQSKLAEIKSRMKTVVDNIEPFRLWTTFERNFLYGFLFNTLSGMMGSQVMAKLPSLFNIGAINSLSNYLSVDGASLAAMNGVLTDVNDNKIGITNGEGTRIDYSRRYDISDSSYFTATDKENMERLKNSTLFGDVNNSVSHDGTVVNKSTTDVGGKFINSIQTAKAFIESAKAGGILGILGGQGLVSSIKGLVDKIGKLIDDIKGIIDHNKSASKDDENKTDVQVKLADTDPTTDDAALVALNYTVYNMVTKGEGLSKTEKDIMAKAWTDIFGQTTPMPEIKPVALFNNGEKILDSREFEKKADVFIAANPSLFKDAKTIDDVMPTLLGQKVEATFMGLKVSDVFDYKIQGAEYGIEGIGLGIFFLTVGLFVGCILLSFIFDRAKRLTKAKWSNWYISKWLLMLTVAFFQVTAEVWVVYAAGWHMIGPTAMCYVWLWLLFCDVIFVTIVQALWFSIKDEIIGKFLCVIVLVTSIAAGGGEFPAISEFGFFRAISYVVPFTYTIKGFDEIAFGISLQGTQGWSTEFMFQQFGIGLIYIAVFMAFGLLVGARFRMREMDYGSHYGFAVAGAMRALGRDTSNFQVLRKVTKKGKKKYYYNWKSLSKSFDPELYFQCREMYKFAGEFKWWQRKHHDFVQKPNYSDEEIITRNE